MISQNDYATITVPGRFVRVLNPPYPFVAGHARWLGLICNVLYNHEGQRQGTEIGTRTETGLLNLRQSSKAGKKNETLGCNVTIIHHKTKDSNGTFYEQLLAYYWPILLG